MAKKKVKKKKKVVKKTAKKKKAVKVSKSVRKVRGKPRARVVKRKTRSGKRKFNIVLKNLLVFVVLFVVSLVLYSATSTPFYVDLFLLASIIFGFVSLAFLIVFLVLVILKWAKK